MTIPLPTRKDEAWRYSDLAALARAWPHPPVEHITVKADSPYVCHILQTADNDAVVVRTIDLTLEAGATASVHLLNTGGTLGRIALNVTLHKGADFTLGAAQIGSGDKTLEIITTVTHAEPDATSRQIVRSILAKGAVGTYLGKVAVARGAQHSDSEQSIRAMLLDRTATANAKPELEIFADDVKCAHGCAIGELDEASLFYLQSRGLEPQTAKKLLLQAFVASVFDGAEAEEILQAAALTALEAML